MSDVPHGQTQRGVSREVVATLMRLFDPKAAIRILDIPAGHGELSAYIAKTFPAWTVVRADITSPPEGAADFVRLDASRPFQLHQQFDAVISVSGVMAFDNTTVFFENCVNHLMENGFLIVTNDNCFTVRDRISYLFFGRFRRFKLLMEAEQPCWHHVAIQELYKIALVQKLTCEDVIYTSFFPEDLAFALLALLVYPLQWLYLRQYTAEFGRHIVRRLFPLKSLLCRHYVIIFRRQGSEGHT